MNITLVPRYQSLTCVSVTQVIM